eukprot:TRINITY_DN56950_c0_g1_i2.p1 TRINITY_DN56950_c0_g1~~TRINITY_DN56950_c0_g1_i2.p1  ORF type:complete len:186 (-),score=29.64 TRINITY_DN56950_c0_g1_i2:3-560(-)
MNLKLITFIIISLHITHTGGQQQLTTNEDGTFKIIQFTDLHLGESSSKDELTVEVLHTVVEKEADTDLLVFTGDLVSGFMGVGQQNWLQKQTKQLWKSLEELSIPFAITMGNHDDEASESRQEAAYHFARQDNLYDLQHTKIGPSNITGEESMLLAVIYTLPENVPPVAAANEFPTVFMIDCAIV